MILEQSVIFLCHIRTTSVQLEITYLDESTWVNVKYKIIRTIHNVIISNARHSYHRFPLLFQKKLLDEGCCVIAISLNCELCQKMFVQFQ